jgi:hypothetical protein
VRVHLAYVQEFNNGYESLALREQICANSSPNNAKPSTTEYTPDFLSEEEEEEQDRIQCRARGHGRNSRRGANFKTAYVIFEI